ncbi:MAG: response regulator [Bacteroidota bacterium]
MKFQNHFISLFGIFSILLLVPLAGIAQSHTSDSQESALIDASFSGGQVGVFVYDSENEVLRDRTEVFRSHQKIQLGPASAYFELRLTDQEQAGHIAYRILGIEDDWTYLGGDRLRIYTPPEGHYQVQVRKVTPDSEQIIGELGFSLIVDPPLNQSVWAWAAATMLAVSLAAIIFLIVRFRQSRLSLKQKVDEQLATIHEQTQQLKDLNASQSNMFKDIVHEIRSPLSLIMGLNEAIMIERYGTTNRNIKGASRIALRNGRKLVKLIEEILELSKLDMIKVELDEKAVNIRSYVQGLYAMLQPKAMAKGIDIQYDDRLTEEDHLLLDLNKFEKIFNNLVENAIKFTPAAGQIFVCLAESTEEGMIDLMVKDTGPGILDKDLHKIFDRHHQIDNVKVSGSYGVGIGLALAKSYAELFQGDIRVESVPGQGTTFVFTFPRKIADRPVNALEEIKYEASRVFPVAISAAKTPLTVSSHPEAFTEGIQTMNAVNPADATGTTLPTVLIVEDNPDMRIFLDELLETHYKVLSAADGIEALEVLEQYASQIDLVVSDIVMPRMDGINLLQKIREHDQWRAMPFLMLTAETQEYRRKDAFTFGVDDYVVKPFSSDELLIRIKTILKNARQRMKWSEDKEDKHLATSGHPKGKLIKMTQADLDWLKKLEETARKEIGNRHFNLLELASVMAVSERQLFRKIKRLTGMTPNKYFRDIKLFKAKEYLENYTYGTISEVSYAVGFEDPYYFSKIYSARFGKKPSAYFVKV